MNEKTTDNHRPWGVLLVGHGTRSEAGCAEFWQIARDVAASLPQAVVEPCFLELQEPDIDHGVERLVQRKVGRICVMPLMLFAAGHVKRDIPCAVEAAARKRDMPPWIQAPHLGCQQRLLELSAQRFREAVADRPSVVPESTRLLFVGRGSRDRSALAEMDRFVRLREALVPVGDTKTCYLAMAEPSLEQVLPIVAGPGVSRVVVQPHLLFAGRMLSSVARWVDAAASANRQLEWVVVKHLGPASLLTRAVVELIESEIGCGQPPQAVHRFGNPKR